VFALEQTVFERAAVPILDAAGLPGERCGVGGQRTTGAVSLVRAVEAAHR
jgi:hypothetical protein